MARASGPLTTVSSSTSDELRGIRVDPGARTVRVEPGCTLADLDHATHAFGLAVPTGIFGTTGIAGLALGGGVGHLTRKHGLTIDNLLEADVLLASGELGHRERDGERRSSSGRSAGAAATSAS